MKARSRRTGGKRGTAPVTRAPPIPRRNEASPTTATATRPPISSCSATRGWISPSTPPAVPPNSTLAERPGWNGGPRGSPRDQSSTPSSPRTASSVPRASKTSKDRRSPAQPSPAGPASANPALRCSSNGSASRNVVPTSKIAIRSTPRAWLLATACSRPGVRRVRRNPSSARSGFAIGIASRSSNSARSSAELNGAGRISRSPTRSIASFARRANAYGSGSPPGWTERGSREPTRS